MKLCEWNIVVFINNIEYRFSLKGLVRIKHTYKDLSIEEEQQIVKRIDDVNKSELPSEEKIKLVNEIIGEVHKKGSNMKEKEMGILEVEEKIINNLDNLDKLFDEYAELCGKPSKTIAPINWIKKKFLFKDIKTEINELGGDLLLLLNTQGSQVLKSTGKELFDSNTNVDIIVEKLLNISKYLKLRMKFNENDEIDDKWYFVQYVLLDQDKLTEQYNEKYAKDIQLKSILAEIKRICTLQGVDYDMFLTRVELYKEEETRGRILQLSQTRSKAPHILKS